MPPLCGLGLRLIPIDERGLSEARGLALPLRKRPALLGGPRETSDNSGAGLWWRPRADEVEVGVGMPVTTRGDAGGDSLRTVVEDELLRLRERCRPKRGRTAVPAAFPAPEDIPAVAILSPI